MTNMEYIESCKQSIENYKTMLEQYKKMVRENKECSKICVDSAKEYREMNKKNRLNSLRIKEHIKDLRQQIKDRKITKTKKICDFDVELSICCLKNLEKNVDKNYSVNFVYSFEQILTTFSKFFDKDKFFSGIEKSEYTEEQIENFEFLVDLIEKNKG